MARAANNFYYQSPMESIGQSLGTALFGNPELAAKQALLKAQMDNYAANASESRAHAGLYGEQTTGEHTKNAATLSLPDLIAHLLPPAAAAPPPVVMPSDPLAALPDVPVAPAGPAPGTFDPHSMASVIAALAQAKGDSVDLGETVGSLGAMLGNDEFARRGLMASGHTPTNDFALTSDRADAIAARDAAAKLREGLGVAEINNRDDIPVANIQAATSRRGQDIGASTARRGQDIGAGTARRGQDIRAGGKETGFSLVSNVLPGARMTGGERTPERNAEVDGAPRSYHLAGDGVEAYDVAPGTGAATFAEAEAKLRAKYGARLVEARDETNRPGHGPHWHFAIQSPPKVAGGKAAAPKGINKASNKLLDDELDAQIEAANMKPTPGARTNMKQRAIAGFQQSGNPVTAVKDVIADVKKRYDAQQASKAPVPGARKAPDGKWYVERGGKYFRVDG